MTHRKSFSVLTISLARETTKRSRTHRKECKIAKLDVTSVRRSIDQFCHHAQEVQGNVTVYFLEIFPMRDAQRQFEEAIERIQCGEMRPSDAAKWLVRPADESRRPRSDGARVSELLRSLGPPPDAIRRDWDSQVANLCAEFQKQHGQMIGPFDANDLRVDDQNQLSFDPDFLATVTPVESPATHAACELSPSEANASSSSLPANGQIRPARTRKPRARKPRARKRWTRKRWAGLAIITTFFLLGVASFGFYNSSRPRDASREVATVKAKSPMITIPTSSKDQISPLPVPPKPVAASKTPPQQSNDKPASPSPTKDRRTLGLDSFAGGNWATASELLPTADFETDEIDVAAEISQDDNLRSQPADAIDADTAPKPNSPDTNAIVEAKDTLPTSSRPDAGAVALPPPFNLGSINIHDQNVTSIDLVFPFEAKLSLQKVGDGWDVIDNKDEAPLAKFANEAKGLSFRWLEAADKNDNAKHMSSGAMICSVDEGTTRTVFLRPVLTTAECNIDTSRRDAHVTWNLGSTPPPGLTKIELEHKLPPSVVQTWVQSPGPLQSRRCRAIAQYALDADQSVAIQSHIDIRTGTTLTLRLRHAVQLDARSPWQAISGPDVRDALARVTEQLARATSNQAELKAMHYTAEPAEKKKLAPMRKAIDEVVANLQSLMKQLAQYNALFDELQNASFVSLRLSVVWPEQTGISSQTIFETSPHAETADQSHARPIAPRR